MKTTYYTLEGNALKKVGNVIKTSRGWVSNPTAEDYASIGAYPRSEESFAPPACGEGYRVVANGYTLDDNKWVKHWDFDRIVYTYDDYNRALEDYIYSVRAERGYDEREPSSYLHSKNPRWKSDAEDWVVFIDDIMTYALPVLNMYLNNEEVPSLEVFKAGFPKIVWSYTEEM
jgi:hypothetical protein